MANTICDVFFEQTIRGRHDWDDDSFKVALYGVDANLDRTTANYSTLHEIVATGYPAGGYDLNITVRGKQIWADNVVIPNLVENDLHFALVYNDTLSGSNAIAVFILDNAVLNGPLTINFSRLPLLHL